MPVSRVPAQWLEMAELQLALGRAAPAAFALEEALLSAPTNAALHTRLAEVRAQQWCCCGHAFATK